MNFKRFRRIVLIFLGISILQLGLGQSNAVLKAALKNPDHSLWSEPAPDKFQAKFWTTKGTFTIEVQRDWAPIGADRFYHHLRRIQK